MSHLFDKPKSKPARRIEQLADEVVRLRSRERELDGEQRTARAEVERLREAHVEELAREAREGSSSKEAANLAKELARAEATAAEPWADRAEAVRRAVRQAEAEVERVKRDEYATLAAELRPDAEAVQQRLTKALTEVVDAARAWDREASRHNVLVKGTGGRHVTELHLGSVVRECRLAVAAGVRPPVPTVAAVVSSEPPAPQAWTAA